jgi:hypothetical protein
MLLAWACVWPLILACTASKYILKGQMSKKNNGNEPSGMNSCTFNAHAQLTPHLLQGTRVSGSPRIYRHGPSKCSAERGVCFLFLVLCSTEPKQTIASMLTCHSKWMMSTGSMPMAFLGSYNHPGNRQRCRCLYGCSSSKTS